LADVSTPSKKGRIQGSEKLDSELHEDSDGSSTVSLDPLVCPATQPSQQSDGPLVKGKGKEPVNQTPPKPSDGVARPQRVRNPPKSLLDSG